MAALPCCRVSPSAAIFAASASVRPPSMLRVPTRDRRACSFPRLKLRQGETAARLPRLVVHASNRGGNVHPQREPAYHFVEERRHIFSRLAKIIHIEEGYLYHEARDMSQLVCISAENALTMASQVVESGNMNLGAPNEISVETINRTMRPYAKIFLQVADDSCNRAVSKSTITTLLGALRGLAFSSHILLENALEALSHKYPKESLSEYAFNCDVSGMQLVYNRLMDDLETGIKNASTSKTCELVMPTIRQGVEATKSFVELMVARRQRALGKANSQVA